MNKFQKELAQLSLDQEKKILARIKKEYNEALNQVNDKIAQLMGRTDTENMSSIIYQLNYQNAIKGQISAILDNLKANNFTSIQDYLKTSYEDGFIGTMYDLQKQGVPLVMPIDQEQMVRAIMHDTKLSDNLYKTLGHNTNALKKEIQQAVSRGISTNDSYANIARNIRINGDKYANKAYRIARTEGHRVNQEANHDAQVEAKKAGADVVKQWDATLDSKTRPAHRALDGQIKEVDEAFEYGGHKAMYPGNFGVGGLDINCRCVSIQRARWAVDDDIDKWDGVNKNHLTIEAKNYEEFRKKYDEVIQNNYGYGNYKNKGSVKNYRKTDISDAIPGDSLSKYSIGGKLTEEREALHQQIIDNFFQDVKPVEGQHTFTVMGGGPASGKSTVVRQGVVHLPDGSIVIDSDAIKGQLPEYKAYLDMKYVKAVNGETVAGFVHEESSALAKRVMEIANGEHYNYVLDGTGDGSIKSLTKKIEQARAAGARVVGEYVTVPTDVALERATARGIKTGRIINPNVITGTHKKVSDILPECAHLFDEVRLYDTTSGAKLIATGGNGKGLIAVNGQEKLFNAFLDKAYDPNIHNVLPSLRYQMSGANVPNLGLKLTTDANAFDDAIRAAQAANKWGGAVDLHSIDELNDFKTFLSKDGMAGVATKPDGNITAVFKNSNSSTRGAVTDLILTARENGGIKMDCYGKTLVNMYEKCGYVPVARIPFNADYVSDPILLRDRPDVFVLMKTSDTTEEVIKKIGEKSYRLSELDDLNKLPVFEDYDEALKYRDELLKPKPVKPKLSIDNFPESFKSTSKVRENTERLIDYVNGQEAANPKVVELYNKLGQMDNFEKDDIPFTIKISNNGGEALVANYYRSSGTVANVTLTLADSTDNIAGNITNLHEMGHLIDFHNRASSKVGYFTSSRHNLYKSIRNTDIGDEIRDLFKQTHQKYVEIDKIFEKVCANEIYDLEELYMNGEISMRTFNTRYDNLFKPYAAQKRALGVAGLEDIYDALSQGMFRKNGIVKNGHGVSYYQGDIENQITEIFANYMELNINRPDLVDMLKRDKPELTKMLDDMIDEMLNK